MPTLAPFRPQVESLDGRDLPATPVSPVSAATAVARTASTAAVGDAVAAYLASQVGKQVGAGECAQMAVEALRAGGAAFVPTDGGTGDYVWSRSLVTRIDAGTGRPLWSAPAARLKVGDVLQFDDVRYRNGASATQHTAVVASVDAAGRPTAVYEQNYGVLRNGVATTIRTVGRNPIDLSGLVAGTVKVYRPDARAASPTRYEFTVVNTSAAATATVTVRVGTAAWASSVGRANTANGFQTQSLTATVARPTITVGTTTLTIESGAGYEVFLLNGKLSVRKLGR